MFFVVFAAHKLCWVCCVCCHDVAMLLSATNPPTPSLYPGPEGAAYKLIFGHLCSQLSESDSQPWSR